MCVFLLASHWIAALLADRSRSVFAFLRIIVDSCWLPLSLLLAYISFLLTSCLYVTQTTALQPVFPGELPTLTMGANPVKFLLLLRTMLGAHCIGLVFQTCLSLAFLASVVAAFKQVLAAKQMSSTTAERTGQLSMSNCLTSMPLEPQCMAMTLYRTRASLVGAASSNIICWSWIQDQCVAPFASCCFVHKYSSCFGQHRVGDCPGDSYSKLSAESKHPLPLLSVPAASPGDLELSALAMS